MQVRALTTFNNGRFRWVDVKRKVSGLKTCDPEEYGCCKRENSDNEGHGADKVILIEPLRDFAFRFRLAYYGVVERCWWRLNISVSLRTFYRSLVL